MDHHMMDEEGLDERVNQDLDQLESLADYGVMGEYQKDEGPYGGRGGRQRSGSDEAEARSSQGYYHRPDDRDQEKLRYAPRRDDYRRDDYQKRRGGFSRGGGDRRWYGNTPPQRHYERSPPRYDKRDSGGYRSMEKHRDEGYRSIRRSPPSPPIQAPPPPRFNKPPSPNRSWTHQVAMASQPYYTQPPPMAIPPPMGIPPPSHPQAPTPPHIRGHNSWSRSRSRSPSRREWGRGRSRNGNRSRSRGDSYSPGRRGQKYGQSRRSSSSSSSSSASSDSSAEVEKKSPKKKKPRKKEPSTPPGDDEEDRANLVKQRDVYLQKLAVLEQQEVLLAKQLADLRRGQDNNPTLLQENLRLQTEIKSKAQTIRDVVNKINIVLGDPVLVEKEVVVEPPEPPPVILPPPKPAVPKLPTPTPVPVPAVVEPSPERDSNAVWHIPAKVDFFDSGQHWCRICNVFPLTIKSLLNHYMSEGHRAQMLEKKVEEQPWHQRQTKDGGPDDQEALVASGLAKREPLKGCQFFVPMRGWYCKLCDSWMGDHHCVTKHLHSQRHNANYARYVEAHPDWETRYWSERAEALEALEEEKDGVHKAPRAKEPPAPPPKVEPPSYDPLPEKEFRNPPKRNQEEEDAWSRSIRVQMRNKRWKEEAPRAESKWAPVDISKEKDMKRLPTGREDGEDRQKHRRHHHHRYNKSDEEDGPSTPPDHKRKSMEQRTPRARHSPGKDMRATKRPPPPKHDPNRSRVKLPFIGRMPVLRTARKKEPTPPKQTQPPPQPKLPPPPPSPPLPALPPTLPPAPPPAPVHYMMYSQPIFPQPMTEYVAPIPAPLPVADPPLPPQNMLSADEIEEMRMLGIDVNDAAAQALSTR